MVVPDKEGLPRYVLVLHDAMRNEVSCACNRLREGRVAVRKVDPLQVLDDLITVQMTPTKDRTAVGRSGTPKRNHAEHHEL